MKFNEERLQGMTADELRQELRKCWEHFAACLKVLHGKTAEPVPMSDLGDSEDLELFYKCQEKGGGK